MLLFGFAWRGAFCVSLKRDAQKSKGRMSLEEKKELLENTALTPGGIFDEFNYFYFGYVSVDWLELVF